jgi:uncharacterized phage protein (TIGR02218 family)
MAKGITANMRTHLAEEVTTLATAWKITRTDGTIFRFTSNSEDITADFGIDIDGATVYKASTGFRRTNIANNAELDVDNLDSVGVFDDASITETDLRAGLFDFAEVWVFFFNHQDTSSAMGIVKMRRGWLGEVIVSPNGLFTTELRGLTQALTRTVGEFYSKDCRADLGDARCRVPIAPPIVPRNTALQVGDFYRVVTASIPAGYTGTLSNIVNAGFEDGNLNGWTVIDGVWRAETVLGPHQAGSWHLEDDDPGGGTLDNIKQEIDLRSSQGGDFPDADVLGGKVSISAEIFGAVASGSDAARFSLEALDKDDNVVGSFGSVDTSSGTYVSLVREAVLPVDTAKVRVTCTSVQVGPAIRAVFDSLSITFQNDGALDGAPCTSYEDRIYEVTTAGTTDIFTPTYDTVVGNTTTDGTAVLTARESWSRSAEVSAVDGTEPRRKFTVTELTPNTGGPRGGFPDDWFNYGGCLFDTGANAGLSMEVKDFVADDGVTITQDIELFTELPFDIAVGDDICIYPGCDKRMVTCRDKFDNIDNGVFEPYVPGQDFLGQYPDAR